MGAPHRGLLVGALRFLIPVLGGLLALFGLTGCDGGAGYQRKGGQWSYNGQPFSPAEPASFRAIDALFARDGRRGYFRGAEVAASDGASFEVLSENEARDQGAVYYCDTTREAQEYWAWRHLRVRRIQDADAASYRVLGHGHSRDRQHVYDQGVPFAVRDVASFAPLNTRFTHDAQRGYFDHVEIPGSEGISFALVDDTDPAYARDRSRAYHGHTELNQPNRGPHPVLRVLKGADLVTLRVLGRGYAADARHVWYGGEPLPQADAATFAVNEDFTGNIDATDARHAWARGAKAAAVPPVSAGSDREQVGAGNGRHR